MTTSFGIATVAIMPRSKLSPTELYCLDLGDLYNFLKKFQPSSKVNIQGMSNIPV